MEDFPNHLVERMLTVARSVNKVVIPAVLLLVALCSFAEVACSGGHWSELPEYICAKYRWDLWIDGFAEEDYAGMNMVLYPIRTDLNRTIEEAKLASILAQEKGLAFAAGLYYCAGGIIPSDFNYSRMVQLGKQEPRVPSLSDDRYWEEVVTKPALALANLSLYYPIYAILWDIELYGRTFVPRPGYSWDQYSLERFGKEKGMTIPKLNDSERYSWMYDQGIQGEFCSWQKEQVFLFASETERLVHEINPDLALGTICLFDDWYDWAIRRGFDNERVPTLLWDEDTYDDYKAQHVEDVIGTIDSLGLNCMYFPGFWLWEVTPEDLVQVMREALTNCKCFWIYPQWDAVPGRQPIEYESVFDFVEDHFFDSNGELAFEGGPRVYPGVSSQVYPDQARQNEGSLEVLLLPSTLPARVRVFPVTVHLDPSRDKVYWRNFSLAEGHAEVTNGSFQLSSESLPVMLYGLDRRDLGLFEQGARVEEILLLWNLSSCIGLESDPAVLSTASEALDALRKGNATLCNSVLGSVQDSFTAELIAMASEYARQAPPAQATYEIRHGLETAADYWDRGSKDGAKHHLMDSLARMCVATVPETRILAMITLLLWMVLAKGRPRLARPNHRQFSAVGKAAWCSEAISRNLSEECRRAVQLSDNSIVKTLFQKHVESVAEKDELNPSDRLGNVAGMFFGLVALAFFLIHRGRPTGFFTEDFGAFAAFLFFTPQILVLAHMAGQAILGRRNMLRPVEAATQTLSLISVAYLFTIFPFDFSHFAEPFPRFLEFTISWINDGIARFIMVVMIIVFGAFSIYTPLLYMHVRRALNRRKSGL